MRPADARRAVETSRKQAAAGKLEDEVARWLRAERGNPSEDVSAYVRVLLESLERSEGFDRALAEHHAAPFGTARHCRAGLESARLGEEADRLLLLALTGQRDPMGRVVPFDPNR